MSHQYDLTLTTYCLFIVEEDQITLKQNVTQFHAIVI